MENQPTSSAIIGYNRKRKPTSSPQQLEPCVICKMPTSGYFGGVLSCSACKKFFIRNRDNFDRLRCVSGHGDCVANAVAFMTPNTPLIRRQFCSKCRLEKCFEAGMPPSSMARENNRRLDINEDPQLLLPKPENSTSLVQFHESGVAPPRTPFNLECIQSESTFHLLMSATAQLSPLDSAPNTIKETIFATDTETWRDAMANFEYVSLHEMGYAKELEKLVKLPMADSCRTFARAIVPLQAAQVSLPSHSKYRFFGMSPRARDAFTAFFPWFQTLVPIVDEIAALLNVWQPNFIEFALLQALIYFQVENIDKLQRPDLVLKANRQVFMLLKTLWNQQGDFTEKKLRLFERVYALIARDYATSFDGVICALSRGRPDIVQTNKLFVQTFID